MESIELECVSCGGTGLYVGFGERNGVAVVCKACDGTGKEILQYKPFTKRRNRKGVATVFAVNPGIGLSVEIPGGLPYIDWKAGKPFTRGSELRDHTCPCWWFQGADYDRKPEWEECRGVCAFSACKQFKSKEKCWQRFDKEKL